jgi:hypothetical protein
MPGLFSSPPKPKAPPKPPQETDPNVQASVVNAKQAYARAGRSQTIFTSPIGVASPGPTAAKTLLGQ